jgi:hypothetical protein
VYVSANQKAVSPNLHRYSPESFAGVYGEQHAHKDTSSGMALGGGMVPGANASRWGCTS